MFRDTSGHVSVYTSKDVALVIESQSCWWFTSGVIMFLYSEQTQTKRAPLCPEMYSELLQLSFSLFPQGSNEQSSNRNITRLLFCSPRFSHFSERETEKQEVNKEEEGLPCCIVNQPCVTTHMLVT